MTTLNIFNFFKYILLVSVFYLIFTTPAFCVTNVTTLAASPVRIKDLVTIRGVRSNQLVGIGIVVGLAGTGDSKSSVATNKSVSNMISRLGVIVDPKEVTTKNIAIVSVTADLPPFSRAGDTINTRLSSLGDASSLEGGTLVLTPLSGADGNVYAVAQGATSQGTAMAGGEGGLGSSNSRSSAPKTIAITNGATVEREFDQSFIREGQIELSLINEDFTTATRVAKAINDHFRGFFAEARNGRLVSVSLPPAARSSSSFNPVDWVAAIEQLRVEPDTKAVVVVNERTGTIVAGAHTAVMPVAISHGTLQISIQEVSQSTNLLPSAPTVGELVKFLNEIGAGPKDLVSILQSLQTAGALKAELKIL